MRGVALLEHPHGTTTGYWLHVRGSKRFPKTTPCDECRRAQREYKAGRRKRAYLTRNAPTVVSSEITVRKIRALMRIGWRAHDIAQIAYPDKASGERLVHRIPHSRNKFVTLETAARIDRAYDTLQYRRGPSNKTARWAAKHGWPAPGCWDNINDINERPKGMLSAA